MGKSVQCCTADPKRVRLAHEKNLTKVPGRSSSPYRFGEAANKGPKVQEIKAPNYDNKYNQVEIRQTHTPTYKKALPEIMPEPDMYDP